MITTLRIDGSYKLTIEIKNLRYIVIHVYWESQLTFVYYKMVNGYWCLFCKLPFKILCFDIWLILIKWVNAFLSSSINWTTK